MIFSFDWFVRLDDDAYVDIEKLVRFLHSVNSSMPLYIGCAGFGKNKNDHLSNNDNYCQVGITIH